uniref:Uncharacterized protein n=1 Tax=Zea mays TaxID=4577 RepID=A0A804QMU3_MAIZE
MTPACLSDESRRVLSRDVIVLCMCVCVFLTCACLVPPPRAWIGTLSIVRRFSAFVSVAALVQTSE